MKPLMHQSVPPFSSLVNFCLHLFPRGVDVKLKGAISATSEGEFYICVISEVILFTCTLARLFYSIFMTIGFFSWVRNKDSILCINVLTINPQYKAANLDNPDF